MFVWLCVCNTDAFILSGWSKCVTYVNIRFLINIKRSGSREQKDWNDVFAFKRKKNRIRHEFARYFVEYDFPIFLLPYSFCLMRHTRLFRIHLIIFIISSVFVSFCTVCVFVLFWYCNMALLKSCTFPFICITFVSRKYAFVFRVYIDFAFTIYSRRLGGRWCSSILGCSHINTIMLQVIDWLLCIWTWHYLLYSLNSWTQYEKIEWIF